MRTTVFLFLTCGLLVAADYLPGPDAQRRDGVPRGKVILGAWNDSKAFPGTTRSYWVYIPAQYDPKRPYQRRDSGTAGDQGNHERGVWRPQHGVPVYHLFRQSLPDEDPETRHCLSEQAAGLSVEEELARGTSSELARASFWFWRANISSLS